MWRIKIKVIERWISNIQNLISLVAEYNNRIVGYTAIYKIPHPRRKGVSDLATYLHQDFYKVALGTAMIAINLYEKFGFKIEGVMKDAYFSTDGKYHDTKVMALTLPHNH